MGLFALAAVGLFVFVFASKKGGAAPTGGATGGGGPGATGTPGGGGPGATPTPGTTPTPGGGGITVKPPTGGGLPGVILPPPAPITPTVRGADGVLVATPTGRAFAIAQLLRYGPVVVELTGTGTGIAGRLASVSKSFLGTVGLPGVPPATVGDSAVEWVRQRLAEGQYVMLPTALFNPLANAATLPDLISILAAMPDGSGPGAQLFPVMAPGQDWVLLGDPAELAPIATGFDAATTAATLLGLFGASP